MRKTKIVCTLGPASSDPEIMAAMLKSGMNVARMNFSHGSHKEHKRRLDTFRRVRDELGLPAAVMLDSMMHSPMPTRAEITDVANAVFDGTSAIMLSGETASGQYPVEAVQAMSRIAKQAEQDAFEMNTYRHIPYDNSFDDTTNAICDAACTTARDVHAKAIIAVTKYGQTARGMSKFRPYEPIIASTPVEKAYHQLSMSWGVYPVLALNQQSTDDLFLHAVDCAKQLDLVSNGDLVVITAGVPLSVSGTTNILKVQVVGDRE